MGRFLLGFFAVFALVLAGTWMWTLRRPMAFLDREYPMWRAKKDMAATLPPNALVILGDSQPMAAFVPEQIGPDVVNLACGGGGPIEAYAVARAAVASGRAPRAVVMSFSPMHFHVTAFWDRGVKFGLIDATMIEEVRTEARKFDDPLFGPQTPGEIDERLKTALYCHRFPSFYFSSLVAGRLFQREKDNWEVYGQVRKSRGQFSFGLQDGSRELYRELISMRTFAPRPLLDSYFTQLVVLLKEHHIPLYFSGFPLNEVSAARLRPQIPVDYVAYLRTFEARYPNFHLLGNPLPVYPWTDFGDDAHLKPMAAIRFSTQIAAQLREMGVVK